jgi:hypothetical protein
MKYTIEVDLTPVLKHFKKLTNKSYEVYLIKHFEYPYTYKAIEEFDKIICNDLEIPKDEMFNFFKETTYNRVVNKVLNTTELLINRTGIVYTRITFSKFIEITNSTIIVEFKYD